MKLKDLKKRDGSGAWPEPSDLTPLDSYEAGIINGAKHVIVNLGSLNLGVDIEAAVKVLLTEEDRSRDYDDNPKLIAHMEDVYRRSFQRLAASLSEWLVAEEAKDERQAEGWGYGIRKVRKHKETEG